MFGKTLKTGVLASLILAVGMLLSDAPKAEAASYGSGVVAHIYKAEVYYVCKHGHSHYVQSYWITYYPSTGHTEGAADLWRGYYYARSKGTPQVRYVFWRTTYNG